MYSYVIEFNLNQRGDDAEDYLTEAVRTWPKLWGDIPGVTGTLLLSNALALGGDFEYQWRVDIDSLATLSRLDEVLKSDDQAWRKAKKEWFKARTSARAQVFSQVDGDKEYCRSWEGRDGAVHLVVHFPTTEAERSAGRLEAVRSVSEVLSAQTLRPLVGRSSSAEQTWLRLANLETLDAVSQIDVSAGSAQLLGEIRELDGSLFAGA